MYGSSPCLVVEFLVLPYKEIDQYVCVPESWQRWRDLNGEVAIAYPEEEPEVTSVRALNNEDSSRRWKIYMAKVYGKKDSYRDALRFITTLEKDKGYKLQNMKTENSANEWNMNKSFSPKSNSMENKTKTTPSSAMKKLNIKETENNAKSPSTPKTNKNRDTKELSPFTPTQSIVKKETEEMTSSTSFPIKVKNEEMKLSSPTQKIVKKDIEDTTPSTSTPKISKNKIEKNKPSPSSANDNKNRSEEKNNQDTGKEKNEVNITPHNKKRNSLYKIPADFNPKDLKDMFRHNSPDLGEVVELLPKTGVFIEVNVLETKFKNYSDMAEGLMKGIFTNKALRNCTLSGEPPISKNHSDSDTRPALDQDAREAIIKYVFENCYKHWKEGRNSIEYAMRKVLAQSRAKQ